MENLKALVYKGGLTPYQKKLAQREFKDLIDRLKLLEKGVKNNTVLPHAIKSICPNCGTPDIIEFIGRNTRECQICAHRWRTII